MASGVACAKNGGAHDLSWLPWSMSEERRARSCAAMTETISARLRARLQLRKWRCFGDRCAGQSATSRSSDGVSAGSTIAVKDMMAREPAGHAARDGVLALPPQGAIVFAPPVPLSEHSTASPLACEHPRPNEFVSLPLATSRRLRAPEPGDRTAGLAFVKLAPRESATPQLARRTCPGGRQGS